MSKYWQGNPILVVGLGVDPKVTMFEERVLDKLREVDVILLQGYVLPEKVAQLEKRIIYLKSEGEDLWSTLKECFGQKVAILGLGDPLFYGIGVTLRERLPAEELKFIPNMSPIQSAFSKIGQPWNNVNIINLKNKNSKMLRANLKSNEWFALIIDEHSLPNIVAAELCLANFSSSPVWVFERLGQEDEQITFDYADALAKSDSNFRAPFLIIFKAEGHGALLPEFVGIEDDLFYQNTEIGLRIRLPQHLRVMLLSLIATRTDEIGWVVGAGIGDVAVEWARWCPNSTIEAIEYSKQKAEQLMRNAERFGVIENLNIHIAAAPPILDDIAGPHSILILIESHDPRFDVILDVCWERLKPGGKLVVATQSEDTKVRLYRYAEMIANVTELEALQLSVSELKKINKEKRLIQDSPLFIAKWIKAW